MPYQIILFDGTGLIGQESAESQTDAREIAIAYISSELATRSQILDDSGRLVARLPRVLYASLP